MISSVTSNILEMFTDLKGRNNFSSVTYAVGQGAKDVGKFVDKVFLDEEKQVRAIVKNKEELAKPEVREDFIRFANMAKDDIKRVLGEVQEKDIPRTVKDFQEMYLGGIQGGMSIGNIKMALALIPDVPQAEPPVKNKPADETLPDGSIGEASNSDKLVEKSFASEDEFVKLIAARREEFTEPDIRKNAEEVIEEMKTEIKINLGSMTVNDLPENADKIREAYLAALLSGMMAGNMKIALALIPAKTI